MGDFQAQPTLPTEFAALASRITALETRSAALAGFEMYLASNVTNHYGTGTFTRVPHDTLAFDYTGATSLANDNFTVPVGMDGWWIFAGGTSTVESLADGNTSAFALYVNSSEFKRFVTLFQGAANQPAEGGCIPVRVAAGDVIDVRFFQASGSAKSAAGGRAVTYFHGVRLGP